MTDMLIVEDIGVEVFPCTQRLLDEAASMADLPIVVTSDQHSLGSFRLASKGKDHHEINVDTSITSPLDVDHANYCLAHEAAHAIRAFTVPPQQRKEVASQNPKDTLIACHSLAVEAVAKGKCDDVEMALDSLRKWKDEIIGWLYGPEEIEVDTYVWQQCPELRNTCRQINVDLQRCARRTLQGDSATEDMVGDGSTCVPLVSCWEPLQSMLCATIYPQLWIVGGWIGEKLTSPFYGFPFALQTGRKLLEIVQQKEPGYLGAIKAREQWIEALGLQDIFRLVAPSEISDYGEPSFVNFTISEAGELVIVG